MLLKAVVPKTSFLTSDAWVEKLKKPLVVLTKSELRSKMSLLLQIAFATLKVSSEPSFTFAELEDFF